MFPSSLRCNRQEARQSQSTIGLFRARRDATMRISLLVCGTKLPIAPVSQAGFAVNFGQDAMRDGEGVAMLAEINPFSRRPPDCDTSHLVATRYACSDGPLSGKGNRVSRGLDHNALGRGHNRLRKLAYSLARAMMLFA